MTDPWEGNPSSPKYSYLRTWPTGVLFAALKASGSFKNIGNRIPGTQILYHHLRHGAPGMTKASTLKDCFEIMTDLQGLAILLLRAPVEKGVRGAIFYFRRRLAVADMAYHSHGGTGDCPCLWCRLWRMRIGEIEEALSEW